MPVVALEHARDELVDRLGKVQHVLASLARALELRQHEYLVDGLAACVKYGRLLVGQLGNVLLERNVLLLRVGIVQKQVLELVLVLAEVIVSAELYSLGERAEKSVVTLAVVFQKLFKLAEHLLFQPVGYRAEPPVLLKRFARNVEREVGRVDHAAHEPEILGYELRALVHYKHAVAVEL